MSRFFVKNIRSEKVCDEVGAVYGCFKTLVVSIEYQKDGGDSGWLTVVKTDDAYLGIPSFFTDDEDRFEKYVDHYDDSKTFAYYGGGTRAYPDFEPVRIDSFEGIDLNCDGCIGEYDNMYYRLYDQIFNSKRDNEAAQFLRFVIALITSGENEADELIELAKGRYIDEIDIPVCEMERRYFNQSVK